MTDLVYNLLDYCFPQRLLLVNTSEENTGVGAGALERENGSAGNDPQPPRGFSQACSQGVTVGGLCGGERDY